MSDFDNFGSFFRENTKLAKDYIETRLKLFKLRLIRGFSKTVGYFLWILISIFLLFLFIIFLGITTGFWLSELTGSYVKGFGLTTLIILVIIFVVALLRNVLFVNPIIRNIISRTMDEEASENPKDNP